MESALAVGSTIGINNVYGRLLLAPIGQPAVAMGTCRSAPYVWLKTPFCQVTKATRPLVVNEAAVDEEVSTRDEGCVIGREEDRCTGDIVWLAESGNEGTREQHLGRARDCQLLR